MFYEQIEQINTSISKTKKAIISLGCSFVQAQGAVDDSLYQEYEWKFERIGTPIAIVVNKDQEENLLSRYPLVKKNFGKLDFTFMEYENSFVNVLCKKYFNEQYTPINLGIRGCGNRATIKELYFHPEIEWHKLEEIIVIYCPSGFERFDFVNDAWNSHNHWSCMWPHYKDPSLEPGGPRQILWEGYSKRLYSSKFEIIEQIGHVQELLNWCKLHNAKLIITPAFDRRYIDKKHFEESLFSGYERNKAGNITGVSSIERETTTDFFQSSLQKELTSLIDLWPWDKMFLPDNFPTFADLCLGQEFPSDWKNRHFFEYNGVFSPNFWITSCAHPSAKGHDLFAKKLFDHISSAVL